MSATNIARGLSRRPSGTSRGLRSGDKGEEQYTPFIVVGTTLTDEGDRPLPAGTVFWESPDLWVEGPGGSTVPSAGVPQTVWARVHNFGLMPANKVSVRFWWTVPSAIITELDATLIDQVNGVTIGPSGDTALVQAGIPWIPQYENEGHECLLVEAWMDALDPLPGPPGSAMDPMVDRHTAQRNVIVSNVEGAGPYSLTINVANGLGAAVKVTAEVASLAPAELEGMIRSDRGLHGLGLTASEAPRNVAAEMRPLGRAYQRSSYQLADRLAEAAARKPLASARDTLCRVADRFEPLEIRRLRLTGRAPRHAHPGTVYGYRIIQRIGEVCVGGCTALIVIARR